MKIDSTIPTCGGGSDEECIIGDCFEIKIYTAAEWAGSKTAITNDVNSTVNALKYTIDSTFYTGSDCSVDNSGSNPVYTCGFVAWFGFNGV